MLPFIAGAVGSYFTFPSVNSWYAYLPKPSFSPPNWVFAPVWTMLYILMGISLYLVWKKYRDLFILHLIINAAWSIAFFGLHEVGLAMVIILLLWGIILAMIIKFYKVSKMASYLLVPYLLWVSFASLLNLSILFLTQV
jgi:tryptophan-rich sensory protein